jgi:hypothetical protein
MTRKGKVVSETSASPTVKFSMVAPIVPAFFAFVCFVVTQMPFAG